MSLAQSVSKSASPESAFAAIKRQHQKMHSHLDSMKKAENPFNSLMATIMLYFFNVCGKYLWYATCFVFERLELANPLKLKQDPNVLNLPAFEEISPPPPLMYTNLNPQQPLLPSVRILREFCKFRYFCSYPNEFTAFRSFCTLHRKDRELQFVLEMIHVIDYLCTGFMNANQFFDSQQIQLLLTFRQLPRSILVVNGKFLGSVVLPAHQPNENPSVWVSNATIILWNSYVLPNSPRQLQCVRRRYYGAPPVPNRMDLRVRFMKLVDIFASAYASLEKLLAAYSVEEMKLEVSKKTSGTHILKSPSMLQQWHAIRQYELQIEHERKLQHIVQH